MANRENDTRNRSFSSSSTSSGLVGGMATISHPSGRSASIKTPTNESSTLSDFINQDLEVQIDGEGQEWNSLSNSPYNVSPRTKVPRSSTHQNNSSTSTTSITSPSSSSDTQYGSNFESGIVNGAVVGADNSEAVKRDIVPWLFEEVNGEGNQSGTLSSNTIGSSSRRGRIGSVS